MSKSIAVPLVDGKMSEVADMIGFNGFPEIGHSLECGLEFLLQFPFLNRIFAVFPLFFRGPAIPGQFRVFQTFAEKIDPFEGAPVARGLPGCRIQQLSCPDENLRWIKIG